MPPIGFTALFFTERYTGNSPSALQYQSTQYLIEHHMTKVMDSPWVWQELERRLANQSLSNQEADNAVEQLITHLNNQPATGTDISWQRSFLNAAIKKRTISESVIFKLCNACYRSSPVIRPLPRLREGKNRLDFEIEYGKLSDFDRLGVELVWQVQRVLIDDKPVKHKQLYKHNSSFQGFFDEIELTAGEHNFTVEIECAYIDQNKLLGLDVNDLPSKKCPSAFKRWNKTISTKLHVFSTGKPLVALVTDAYKNPGPTGGVKIVRLIAQNYQGGKKRVALKTECDTQPMPLSYDVSMAFDGQSVKLGRLWIFRNGNSITGGGDQMDAYIDKLPATVRTVDIILTPNPKAIEQLPEVNEIWGKETIIKNIEIERLDLDE